MIKKSHRPNQAARMQQPDLTTQFFSPVIATTGRSKRKRNDTFTKRRGDGENGDAVEAVSTRPPEPPSTFCVSRLHKDHTNETQTTAISQALSQLGLNNKDPDPFTFGVEHLYPGFCNDENNQQMEPLTNPFADRRRKANLGIAGLNTSFPFSSAQPHSMLDDNQLKNIASPGYGMFRNGRKEQIPPWWKNRSFSSATCFGPPGQTKQKPEIDECLLSSYDTRASQESYYKSLSMKENWARVKAKKKVLRRPVEVENFDEIEADEEIMGGKGVMLNQIVHQGVNGQFTDSELLWKYQRDVEFIKETILKETEGNIDAIRDLRFLIASVQTYGNIDGICYPAEFAMNEFTLLSGIVERLHAVVGPWALDNETQRRRASRHAFETHQIPLQHHLATMTKRKLVEEILGRSEPGIAIRQGVKVGLYSNTCDEAFKVHLHVKNSFKDAAMVTDEDERRFILVLQSEYNVMVESLKQLGSSIGLQYEGFPTTANRFILVEAFIDAVSEILEVSVNADILKWFSTLGSKDQKTTKSKTELAWEKNIDLHCSRHTSTKNPFCAQAIVCRANFMLLHVLGSFFRQYHIKKYPANKALPTPVMSLLPSLRAATNQPAD